MRQRSRIDQVALLALVVIAVMAVATAGAVPLSETEGRAADSNVSTAQNGETISYLSPSESAVEREDYQQTGFDVSAAIAVDMQQLQGNFSRYAYEERKEASEQSESIFDENVAREIGNTVIELDERYQEMVMAYNDGSLSTGSLLRELLRIETAATEQQKLAALLESRPEAVSTTPVVLPKPVSEQLETSVLGGEPTTVYVQSSADGLVLAVAGDTQIRQSVLWSERNRTASNQFENSIEVINRAGEVYPWARISFVNEQEFEIWWVEHREPPTHMRAYFDGGTQNVFYETHSIESTQIPVSGTATNSSQGLEVQVNATQPTGPMEVIVTDTSTGQPVNATVSVDDRVVGSTGSDGRLWAVQPLGTFDAEVTTDESTVTVTGP